MTVKSRATGAARGVNRALLGESCERLPGTRLVTRQLPMCRCLFHGIFSFHSPSICYWVSIQTPASERAPLEPGTRVKSSRSAWFLSNLLFLVVFSTSWLRSHFEKLKKCFRCCRHAQPPLADCEEKTGRPEIVPPWEEMVPSAEVYLSPESRNTSP